jgi:hypothetical protein
MTHHLGKDSTFQFRTFEGGRLRFVSGAFDDVGNAEKAVQALEQRGFGRNEITVLMPESVRARYQKEGSEVDLEKGTKAVKGLGAGSAIGGTVGAIVGAIAAAGTSLIIPGLGLIVAGPLAAALAGAGAGGATGGILGALAGAGLPEYRAKYYEQKVKEGSIVVGVEARTEEEADTIEDELKDAGADDVKQVETAGRAV